MATLDGDKRAAVETNICGIFDYKFSDLAWLFYILCYVYTSVLGVFCSNLDIWYRSDTDPKV